MPHLIYSDSIWVFSPLLSHYHQLGEVCGGIRKIQSEALKVFDVYETWCKRKICVTRSLIELKFLCGCVLEDSKETETFIELATAIPLTRSFEGKLYARGIANSNSLFARVNDSSKIGANYPKFTGNENFSN
jgi:hypothetical protein